MTETLWIAVLGMAVVYLVLGVNFGLILLIGLLRPKPVESPGEIVSEPEDVVPDGGANSEEASVADERQPARETGTQGEGIDPRILAAIGAALRAYERDEVTASGN